MTTVGSGLTSLHFEASTAARAARAGSCQPAPRIPHRKGGADWTDTKALPLPPHEEAAPRGIKLWTLSQPTTQASRMRRAGWRKAEQQRSGGRLPRGSLCSHPVQAPERIRWIILPLLLPLEELWVRALMRLPWIDHLLFPGHPVQAAAPGRCARIQNLNSKLRRCIKNTCVSCACKDHNAGDAASFASDLQVQCPNCEMG